VIKQYQLEAVLGRYTYKAPKPPLPPLPYWGNILPTEWSVLILGGLAPFSLFFLYKVILAAGNGRYIPDLSNYPFN